MGFQTARSGTFRLTPMKFGYGLTFLNLPFQIHGFAGECKFEFFRINNKMDGEVAKAIEIIDGRVAPYKLNEVHVPYMMFKLSMEEIIMLIRLNCISPEYVYLCALSWNRREYLHEIHINQARKVANYSPAVDGYLIRELNKWTVGGQIDPEYCNGWY
jgi:hypothetical protein